jgi:phage terminase large subunit GpA-like protein
LISSLEFFDFMEANRRWVVGQFDCGNESALGIKRVRSHIAGMVQTYAGGIHLVRVTTDDRKHRIYATAGARDDAVTQVLDAVPEGWAASLLTNHLTPDHVVLLNLKPGEVREITE